MQDIKLTVHPHFTPAGGDRTRHGSTLGITLGVMRWFLADSFLWTGEPPRPWYDLRLQIEPDDRGVWRILGTHPRIPWRKSINCRVKKVQL